MTLALCSIVVFALLALISQQCWAQELSVPLNIDQKVYDVIFDASLVSSAEVAQRFCMEQATAFGLTDATFSSCTKPIEQTVQRYVDDFAAKNTIMINLMISDVPFDISFRVDRAEPQGVANQLCVENAQTLGVTNENLANCVAPIAARLTTEVNQFLSRRTVTIPLVINDIEINAKYRPDLNAPLDVARKICEDQGASIGVTSETVESCLNGVNNAISEFLTTKEVKIPLSISNVTFDVTVLPTHDAVDTAATRICTEYASQIGVTEETASICISDVGNFMRRHILDLGPTLEFMSL